MGQVSQLGVNIRGLPGLNIRGLPPGPLAITKQSLPIGFEGDQTFVRSLSSARENPSAGTPPNLKFGFSTSIPHRSSSKPPNPRDSLTRDSRLENPSPVPRVVKQVPGKPLPSMKVSGCCLGPWKVPPVLFLLWKLGVEIWDGSQTRTRNGGHQIMNPLTTCGCRFLHCQLHRTGPELEFWWKS